MQNNDMKHEELTRSIIGCAFEVMNELGAGFLESVYEKALVLALKQKGLDVSAQHSVSVSFRGEVIGDFYAYLLVEESVIVELKAVRSLAPEHQAQVINYLNASGIEIGLLINFGNPKLDYRRLTRNRKPSVDEQK